MTKSPSLQDLRRAKARALRAATTDAESRLWRRLKQSPILGSHFRRQVAIGPYVADFACMAARLVIEIDGSQHGLQQNAERDAARTRWLESEGYRVLRFWNNDVSQNIDGVLEAIHATVPGSVELGAVPLKHTRRRRGDVTPPRRAARADPPPPGEGEEK